MKNIYNINLVNQFKNPELYIDKLFNSILSKTDIKELQKENFSICFRKEINIKGNLESFLENGIRYPDLNKERMYVKMKSLWKEELLKPLYFVEFNSNIYILEQSGYEIIVNTDKYLTLLSEDKVPALTDTEEKFIIDWSFKESTIHIYMRNEKTINFIYNIFKNQKDYINKKNEKSTVNNFVQNKELKNILKLFTQEQKESLMETAIKSEEIIKIYYSKLFKKNMFDLYEQTRQFTSKEIVQSLKENISLDEKDWFKVFYEKGSALTTKELNNNINNITNGLNFSPPKEKILALREGIKLLKKIHKDFAHEEVSKLMITAIIKIKNLDLYKDLRTFIELPQDIMFKDFLNRSSIGGKTLDVIEKEIKLIKLKEKLEITLGVKKDGGKKNKI